eukprot:4888509-Prorocentrum_lima.AAC.1
MSAIKAAQLSKGCLEEVEAMAMVVRVGLEKETLSTEEQFEAFDPAISAVKDLRNAIAHSLALYPGGRNLCKAADQAKI